MVRTRRRWRPKEKLNKGTWSAEEDDILSNYVNTHGPNGWGSLPYKAGLNRCGKSCRLRWLNYLRPDVRRENISSDEEELIIRMHRLLGNRWSLIAGRLCGRTDNQIKNYWNTHIRKKLVTSISISESNNSTPKSNVRQSKYNSSPSIIRPVPYKYLSSSSIVDVVESSEELIIPNPRGQIFDDSLMTDPAHNPDTAQKDDSLLFDMTSLGTKLTPEMVSFPESDEASCNFDLSFFWSAFFELDI